MPEISGCSVCGADVHRHGFPRYIEWGGMRLAFCSFLCEYLWRSKRDATIIGAVSSPLSVTRH